MWGRIRLGKVNTDSERKEQRGLLKSSPQSKGKTHAFNHWFPQNFTLFGTN